MIPRRRHSPMPHRSVQSPNQKLPELVGREQDLCDRGNYLLSGEGLNIFSSLRPSLSTSAGRQKEVEMEQNGPPFENISGRFFV